MPEEEKQAQTETSRLRFDQKVILPVAALFQDLFKEVPELRSVCVVLDWHGDLNKATPPCLWFDETGQVAERKGTGDAIVGSMERLVQALSHQTEVGLKLVAAYDTAIKQKSQLLADIEQRMSKHSEQLEQLADKGQAAASAAREPEGSPGVRKTPGVNPGGAKD